ncbi:NAD(P)-dependent oxidoreductase [Methylobacterium nodulans]|uniref:6-phosphogluconate dehydrogenase NAD-binding n=1 Tax=Methylobacterium nodulans (strain LMG 21967 / CNCM I-2342 / ORS 2060) TaxID=460265 RepID=B8IWD2_METNO|nr:NAD(P)-dependent oxidoreductase [Methylobacterium nodulans]ACL62722.1 6-phosphogluconate dehydrogenase NAD-binding [Methylobacterium nodulans ORS 2060]
MTTTSPSVAFLGIGLMGGPQARNLLKAGFAVTAWNRSPAKAEALAPLGAQVASTPAEAVRGAEVTVIMLENGPIVADVLFAKGAAEALAPGSVVVDMSSIKPAEAIDHAHRLAARGVAYVDAPVSGGTVGAEQGTLAIMAGGDAAVFALVEPVLRAMGRPVHVGPAGAGQFAKLANQIIVGVTIGAVAEALLLARQGGADPIKVREALRGGFAESRILDLHAQRMIERDFATRGRSVTHLKDLDNALDAAGALDVAAVPYTALTADLFRGLLTNAGDLDHSGLILELERRNGIAT